MAEINDILVVLSDLAKRNYFIPSYQRGYRWEKQQVTELLDDIWDFAETKQDYYCLQPIVVRKMSNDMVVQYELSSETGGDWYEVIDGQQRLTTIGLVFQYFNEHPSIVFNSNIAHTYLTMGDRDQALPFYEKTRAITKELYGDDYMDDCYEFRVLDAAMNLKHMHKKIVNPLNVK